ncbi:hypothetical protein BZA70DRAFT_285817 [Myxozyma melibiosi]|uniref:RRM domain-containing protein n=1 Tax=Myxozyma melibiosi TaxID=54550 RepID=A0ABR1EXW7_9ASCO
MSAQMFDQADDEDLFTDLYGDESPAIKELPNRREQSSTTKTTPQQPSQTNQTSYGQSSQDSPQPYNDYSNSNNNNNNSWQTEASRPQQSQSAGADNDSGSSDDGKMFIGGLNWDTTDETLMRYFSQYGPVLECQVMRDPATGRSRGFAFLTFKDSKCVNSVMVKEHVLDGKIIDPKRAIPKDEQEKTSKIFVGGVAPGVTEPEFRQTFSQFGRVIDASLMVDKDTGRSRGFGFITFDGEAAVDNTLAHCPLVIGGKMVEVKKAQPKGVVNKERFDDDKMDMGGRQQQFMKYDGREYGGDGMAEGMGTDYNSAESYPNGMTPSMLAQYWYRTQLYLNALEKIQTNGYEASAMAYAYQQQQQQQQNETSEEAGSGSPTQNAGSSQTPEPSDRRQMLPAGPQGGAGIPTGPSQSAGKPIPSGPSGIPKGPSSIIPKGPATMAKNLPPGIPTGPTIMAQRERHNTPGSVGSPQNSDIANDLPIKPPSGPKALRNQQFAAPTGPRQNVPFIRGRGRGGYGRGGGYHPYSR